MNSIIEKIAASEGVDVHRRSLDGPDRKFIVSNLKPVPCETDNAPMEITDTEVAFTAAQAEPNENWNVAAILCGDGEFYISSGAYFCSGSLDGSVSGF